MAEQDMPVAIRAEGAAFTWLLEHVLTYPGSYEIPLRTMYTLNSTSHTRERSSSSNVLGNAFPSTKPQEPEASHTASAAAQLRANLMLHIAAQPSQPQSLPPGFITNFVTRCFCTELTRVDFPQALTALDYLKDLEMRRRNEVLAVLTHLGLDRSDLENKEKLQKEYPNAVEWIEGMEAKERKVETLYTHVYLGLRRWALVNEMSLQPFNKSNCMAMLNTLYPPVLAGTQYIPATSQLTEKILKVQRDTFFRYIQGVEKKGTTILKNVIMQHARAGEETGWPKVQDDLDNYLRMANSIIDECLETTGRSISPRSANFPRAEDESKRKVDSGISFGSGFTSNRSSGQSHLTRPSTSSTVSNHSRHTSKDKQVVRSLPSPTEEEIITLKPAGSALERIARELRKIGSRGNLRDESRSRPLHVQTNEDIPMAEADSPPPTPGRGLRWKRSLKNMRSSSRVRSNSTSRPGSRNGSVGQAEEMPDFDTEAMRRHREAWEAQNNHAR